MPLNYCSLPLLATCSLITLHATLEAAERQSPNFIVIFADDLGYGDIGCFNEECEHETPNLDRMAAEGAMLTSFYVPMPYCAPSRGTILTGRYPFRHTVVENPAPDDGRHQIGLPASEVTIAEQLKTAGYATAAIGKWHLGHFPQWLPHTQGFDEYFGILYSNDMWPVQLVERDQVVEYPVVQAGLTHRYTDKAIDFIRRHQEEPFFIYLPHAMPHKPLAASEQFYTPETPDDLYSDVIRELDYEVGRLLDELKELGLDEKTMVLFTSDNGAWFGGSNANLRGMKVTNWEGGIRVPLIARYPGVIPAGVVNTEPAGTIDVLPTICELAGVGSPRDRVIDGRNILPMMQNEGADSPHEAIYSMSGGKLASIRVGKWKLHVRSRLTRMFGNLSRRQQENWVDDRAPDGVSIIAPYEQAKPTDYPGVETGDKP
ncbi:MAG: sulfatase, partial [Planctomycetaceae bacterium]|nr:sulfatase [Planctomycetaceae bacterium]